MPLSARYYRASSDYKGDPLTMNMIVDAIYGAEQKIDKPCKTDLLYEIGSLNGSKITFNSPPGSHYPRAWLIVSASQEEDIAKGDIVGSITINGNMEDTNKLVWGGNIAHWSMSNDAKIFSSDDSSDRKIRIFDYYKDKGDGVFHVSQLFLIGVNIPNGLEGPSITLRDESEHVKIAVLGAIWGSAPKPLNTRTSSYCLKDIKQGSIDIYVPEFSDYFKGYGDQGISTNCEEVRFTEMVSGIPFRFWNHFLRTKTNKETTGASMIKLRLMPTNAVQATHLYLVMSMRNFCIAKSETDIGIITIAGREFPLNLGVNVRQARTGPDCLQTYPSDLLYLPPRSGQADQETIVGLPGLPFRAQKIRPNEPPDNKPVELWLDLIKITLPDKMLDGQPIPYGQPIDVAIKVSSSQDSTETAFIAVYAATLVHEDPTP